jgi:dTDP-4-dehydrorhamnose reductase
MRLLLFGPNGQIGRALCGSLATAGELVPLGRAEADFEQPGEVARLIRRHRPQVVVNAAAYTAVDRAETEPERARCVNAEAVAEIAGAVREVGAWLVHFSTDYVFDGRKADPYTETDPPAPLNIYGRTKSEGDAAIARSGCRHLIFRVSWVYGDGAGNFPATMLRLARTRPELRVVGDQIGAPTSARFIAGATAEAIRRLGGPDAPAPGLYHLAAAGAVSRADYARFVIAAAAAHGAGLALDPDAVIPVPSVEFPTPAARPLNSRLQTGKFSATFGVALPDWQEGVHQWVTRAMETGL